MRLPWPPRAGEGRKGASPGTSPATPPEGQSEPDMLSEWGQQCLRPLANGAVPLASEQLQCHAPLRGRDAALS